MSTKKQEQELIKKLKPFASEYRAVVTTGFNDRWGKINQEIYNKHVSESIGALLARQATLSIQMAYAPPLWNIHVSPLFLRCMADAHITLAWILSNPQERSKEYVMYGLGQEKLYISHLEKELETPESLDIESTKKAIAFRKDLLNAQLADWAIEVNIGSWSGVPIRKMAEEVGEGSFYNFVYALFSGAVHNMWQYVSLCNTEPCSNPLHKWHRVPKIPDDRFFDVHFMYLSARHITRTFDLFDEKMGIECSVQSPQEFFEEFFSSEFEDDS